MYTLHALAQSLYKGLEPTESKALTDMVMVISLCSMTVGETKCQLEETIQTCHREKRKLKWELLLEGVMLLVLQPCHFLSRSSVSQC
jgi:hypothetical protein